MKNVSSRLSIPLHFILLSVSAAFAANVDQNWPQWRGPLQTGAAPSANPPTTWSETENIKWKVKIPGEGTATPVVWGNQIFIQTAIPTGKKVEVAATDSAEKSPARPEPGPGGPPGGGRGGFGPGNMVAPRMLADGDIDKDQKLSKEEFVSLSGTWFDKLDSDKVGKLEKDKFSERITTLLPPPDGGSGGPGAPGGQGGRGGRGGRFLGSGLFDATDGNKDGSLTRDEFKAAFTKWFGDWDTDKNGSLSEAELREGLNAVLPRPQFGGQGAGRGGRGGMGGEKPTETFQFALQCLDRQTGKLLWQKIAKEELPHEGYRQGDGSFASSSGLTDGQHVFAYFGSRGLYAYDLNGKPEWNKELGKMRIAMGFGEGSSPALYKDRLIVNWDNEDGSFIVALDKNSGKELWKQNRDERTSWATPLVVEHDGKAEVVTSATGKIRSYNIATGKQVWECSGLTRNVIPSPVADADTVYCISGFQGAALLAIKLGHSGDLTGTDAVSWTYKKSTPYVPSPLLVDEKLYFLASNNGRLSCVDARSGKVLIDAEQLEDIPGVYASPIAASGRIYLPGRNGTTVVLKQSDKVEKLAANKLDDKFDASPVAVGKDLILRGREYVYCISEK
ncbi:MAG TPA: PQQ-binding-like beta-propeller repeat protein [Candidatus Dormibacteraeota bacterium]|nr:PQQ-binding-like beta-propeller repeat protein [Candidatus Dormibacteraeota bacterium]